MFFSSVRDRLAGKVSIESVESFDCSLISEGFFLRRVCLTGVGSVDGAVARDVNLELRVARTGVSAITAGTPVEVSETSDVMLTELSCCFRGGRPRLTDLVWGSA